MKNTFILFLVALSFVCSSCNRTPSVEEPDVLKVELKETPVSVSDFFSKVEVIPLETSDSCLLARILRVRVSGDTTYILTQDYPTFRHITLMAFDKKGNYLRSIGRVVNIHRFMMPLSVSSGTGYICYLLSDRCIPIVWMVRL